MCHIARRPNKRFINEYILGNTIKDRNPYSNNIITKLAMAWIHIIQGDLKVSVHLIFTIHVFLASLLGSI
jgi:hypothetical protein